MALRSRAFFPASDLIAVFWRRDRRRTLRSSASMPDSFSDNAFRAVRSRASRTSAPSLPALAVWTDLRSWAVSLCSRRIVVFWRRDRLRTLRR